MGSADCYREIVDAVSSGRSVFLETTFIGRSGDMRESLRRKLSEAEAGAELKPRHQESGGVHLFVEPFAPPERLIVLGCGHIAVPLCDFASKTGFRVSLLDDRPFFADPARFPGAKAVLCDSFPEGIGKLRVAPSDFVVVVTRGHRYDRDCLHAVLGAGAPFPAYIGMIGSRRRTAELLRLLEAEGLDRERLSRICTPIGLKIGASSPEEIAVSILAELIAYRRLPETRRNPVNESDADPEILRFLAEDGSPKALATVLSTKGSTPRRAGARMCVDRAGRVTGSIGGGCAEGEIVNDAVALIGTGGYAVKRIDMTGDIAEAEGMVCGGTMEVLIEDASPAV